MNSWYGGRSSHRVKCHGDEETGWPTGLRRGLVYSFTASRTSGYLRSRRERGQEPGSQSSWGLRVRESRGLRLQQGRRIHNTCSQSRSRCRKAGRQGAGAPRGHGPLVTTWSQPTSPRLLLVGCGRQEARRSRVGCRGAGSPAELQGSRPAPSQEAAGTRTGAALLMPRHPRVFTSLGQQNTICLIPPPENFLSRKRLTSVPGTCS